MELDKHVKRAINERLPKDIFNIIFNTDVDDIQMLKPIILEQFKNIQLHTIEGFVPCQQKLYVTRGNLAQTIIHAIHASKYSRQVSYDRWEYYRGLTFQIISEIVSEGTKILAKKQQGK